MSLVAHYTTELEVLRELLGERLSSGGELEVDV
jgi:hypothetical protein